MNAEPPTVQERFRAFADKMLNLAESNRGDFSLEQFKVAAICEIAAAAIDISNSLGKLETLDGILSAADQIAYPDQRPT